jgi:hypothetical protein
MEKCQARGYAKADGTIFQVNAANADVENLEEA